MAKVYLAKLERFGYEITAIGKTKHEAKNAVIDSYIKAYTAENKTDPAKDKIIDFYSSGQTYLDLAERELYVQELNYGEAIWL